MMNRNLAVNVDDEWLVVSASSVTADDLVRLGKLLGVVE